MFLARFNRTKRKIDANKRMEAIRNKNNNGFDPVYGAITMTFFPINMLLVPFVFLLLLLKSHRLNEFVLKLQYSALVFGYSIIGVFASSVLVPLLYFKCILNTIFRIY